MRFHRWIVIVLSVLSMGWLLPSARPAAALVSNRLCFDAVSDCIEGRFREYWQQNGGLPVFGYPISPARAEVNPDTGATYLTQWFERNRFELHPENSAPYDVLLGRLGDEALRQTGINWRSFPQADGAQSGCLWFAETRHTVCDQAAGLGFKTYWEQHGLEFDGKAGPSYAESLALFGLPLSEPHIETNAEGDTVLTQWFERARFEWHPQEADAFKVLLGLLGKQVYAPFALLPNSQLSGQIVVQQASSLYALRANGSGITALFGSDNPNLLLSPDGTKLVQRTACGSSYGLCLINLSSGVRTLITADNATVPNDWSRDGRYIAYISGQENHRGVFVYDVQQGSLTQVADGEPSRMPSNAQFAPDAAQLVYQSNYSDQGVYIVNRDGTNRRQIVDYGMTPQWSPDGTQIALVQTHHGNDDVYLYNLATKQLRQATTGAGSDRAPRWSPDGRWLAYISQAAQSSIPGAQPPTALVVADAADQNPQTVLSTSAESLGTAYFMGGYTWSPDSTALAANFNCARLCGPTKLLAGKVDRSWSGVVAQTTGPGMELFLIDWLQ